MHSSSCENNILSCSEFSEERKKTPLFLHAFGNILFSVFLSRDAFSHPFMWMMILCQGTMVEDDFHGSRPWNAIVNGQIMVSVLHWVLDNRAQHTSALCLAYHHQVVTNNRYVYLDWTKQVYFHIVLQKSTTLIWNTVRGFEWEYMKR